MKPEDSTAESLEQRGLWHRAARRWLSVMDATMDDAMRETLARRREHCLSMAANLPPDGPLSQDGCTKPGNAIMKDIEPEKFCSSWQHSPLD